MFSLLFFAPVALMLLAIAVNFLITPYLFSLNSLYAFVRKRTKYVEAAGVKISAVAFGARAWLYKWFSLERIDMCRIA